MEYTLIIIDNLKSFIGKRISGIEMIILLYVTEMQQYLVASMLGGMVLEHWKVSHVPLLVMLFDICEEVKVDDKTGRNGY